MDEHILDKTISFIEKHINKYPDLKELHITWFGGEPLLELNTIICFTEKVSDLCNFRNITYKATMISNGTLLTKDTIHILYKKCFLSKIQITIDGMERYYQLYKRSSAATFKTLLGCIPAFCGAMKLCNCIIGPTGELYRCEHCFGLNNWVIGDIETGFYRNNIEMKFINDPIEDKCKSCIVFPLCCGGCPGEKLLNNIDLDCDTFIKNVVNRVRRAVEMKQSHSLP